MRRRDRLRTQPPGLMLVWLVGMVLTAADVAAQTTVILPDTSQTTAVTVNLSESARVTIPSSAVFNVSNVATATTSGNLTVSLQDLFRKSSTTGVAISLRATALNFTAPQNGAVTWSASDVSWATASWTGGTASAGTLSNASFNRVVTCTTTGCSTNTFTLQLAAKQTVNRAGAHTLVVIWKIETLQ